MLHITDAMVDTLVSTDQALQAMHRAFAAFGAGEAAMQARERTDAGGVKLSTLGAVIPAQGVTGAKVYTTIAGQFNFVILLFSTETGAPLATLDANAITRLRTAATTVLVAQHLAPANARHLFLCGAGVQGLAHAQQMVQHFGLQRIDPAAWKHAWHSSPVCPKRRSAAWRTPRASARPTSSSPPRAPRSRCSTGNMSPPMHWSLRLAPACPTPANSTMPCWRVRS
jgi:Ornithine cyclodeaminase/mu-crystallin family